jgi:hypothetical protein
MDDHYWIRLLSWRHKIKPETKSGQIKFAPELRICPEKGWINLALLLANRSSWTLWVEEATVVLADLDAICQSEVAPRQARHEILQNVAPNETLSVSLAKAIYDAAGRPQGPYSCLVRTDVRYRVFDEWCDAKVESCRVEMAGLIAVGLSSARWYDKKIKQFNGSADVAAKKHKA